MQAFFIFIAGRILVGMSFLRIVFHSYYYYGKTGAGSVSRSGNAMSVPVIGSLLCGEPKLQEFFLLFFDVVFHLALRRLHGCSTISTLIRRYYWQIWALARWQVELTWMTLARKG